jgi:hypothetical protein
MDDLLEEERVDGDDDDLRRLFFDHRDSERDSLFEPGHSQAFLTGIPLSSLSTSAPSLVYAKAEPFDSIASRKAWVFSLTDHPNSVLRHTTYGTG